MLDVFCYSVVGTPTVVTAQGLLGLLGITGGAPTVLTGVR